MLTYPCHISLAGCTASFRLRLRHLLKLAECEGNWQSPVVAEGATLDAFEKGVDKKTDIVMIDASFVIKARKRLSRIWRKLRPDCSFALLFCGKDDGKLLKVLTQMGKQDSLPSDVFVLKDNYPDELIERMMKRMVELKFSERNLSVI